ncbi:MAG: 6-bladed beta-propeller [bacterium]
MKERFRISTRTTHVLTFFFALTAGIIIYLVIHDSNSMAFPPAQPITYSMLLDPGATLVDTSAIISVPGRMQFDPEGNVYILETHFRGGLQDRIYKFDPKFNHKKLIGEVGRGPGEYTRPTDIWIDKRGYLYVPDVGNQRISIWNNTDTLVKLITNIFIPSDTRIAVDSKGFIYLSSFFTDSLVRKLSPDGSFLRLFGKKNQNKDRSIVRLENENSIDFDSDGRLWMSFRYRPVIRTYDTTGVLLWEREFLTPEMEEERKKYAGKPGALEYNVDIASVPWGGILLFTRNHINLLNHKTGAIQFRYRTPELQYGMVDDILFCQNDSSLWCASAHFGHILKFDFAPDTQ